MAHVPECLKSLQNQTRQDFETVIVDDGSTEDIQSIVEPLGHESLDIKYVRHPLNLGALRARLTGADNASGDYVGFLDSDDTACPDFVEQLLGTAEKTGADIVGSSRFEKAKNVHFAIAGADAILKAYADKTICNWNVWTKLYRRSLVLSQDELRGIAEAEKIRNAEDLMFNVFCALKDPAYVHIPNILVQYNSVRKGSSTNPISSKTIRESVHDSMRAYEIMSEAASDFGDSVQTIIEKSAKFTYEKLLVPGDEEDFAWACSRIDRSPVGSLVMSAMFERSNELRFKYSDQKDQVAKLKERLALSRRDSTQVKQRLKDVREQFREARERRQKLRPILGDLWRWCRAVLTARS